MTSDLESIARVVARLFRQHGMDTVEIARLLGVPEHVVANALQRDGERRERRAS